MFAHKVGCGAFAAIIVVGEIATILTPFGVQTCDVFVVWRIVTLFISWCDEWCDWFWVKDCNEFECGEWDWLVVIVDETAVEVAVAVAVTDGGGGGCGCGTVWVVLDWYDGVDDTNCWPSAGAR